MARKPKLPAIQRAWLHAKLRDEGACHSHAEAAMQYAEKHSSLIAALRSLDPKKRDHRMWLRWVVGFVTTWRQLERMEWRLQPSELGTLLRVGRATRAGART
jgi:hypothetical protein